MDHQVVDEANFRKVVDIAAQWKVPVFVDDASGARICGKPLALASALLKLDDYAHHRVIPDAKPATSGLFIINPLAGVGGVANLFSTHPSTEERVKKLREIAAEMHSF